MAGVSEAVDLWAREKLRTAGFADAPSFLAEFGQKPYRLGQLYRAATKELVENLSDVTVLPAALRETLSSRGLRFSSVEPVTLQRSKDEQTTKGLFHLADGLEVETVLMEHHNERSTVCISSQAGCAYKCAFCSTGQAGFARHLQATEIFDQARFFAIELSRKRKKITNIVFMGMGEPFANYHGVMDAVRLLNDPQGFGLGHRHITISTVGLVPEIDAFADEGIQVNLAISLHAPTDEIRSSIMPVNLRYPISELMAACERYVKKTKRKIFFEYVMLAGVNDGPESARLLVKLMRGHLYHVNLIPYNATPDSALRGSDEAHLKTFHDILEAAGVPCTVRVPMGRDIAAACGQLRAQTQPKARAS